MSLPRLLPLLCLALVVSSCAAKINPWERGNLAKPQMAIEPDPTAATVRQHMFFSKEGASGGYGAGGGGCGCN